MPSILIICGWWIIDNSQKFTNLPPILITISQFTPLPQVACSSSSSPCLQKSGISPSPVLSCGNCLIENQGSGHPKHVVLLMILFRGNTWCHQSVERFCGMRVFQDSARSHQFSSLSAVSYVFSRKQRTLQAFGGDHGVSETQSGRPLEQSLLFGMVFNKNTGPVILQIIPC